MILEELVLHNFGLYKGRQSIELSTTISKPVVLFGGLNGAGKTTLVDALQLSLYGKLANCSNRGSLSYEEFLAKSIHRAVNPSEGAALELQFRNRADGKDHTYRIHRSWSLRGKSIRENTEVLRDGQPDQLLTEAWQEQVEEFIPSSVSHLFFFDGEKIETLANTENSAQLLSTAVHALLGLDIVDRLTTDLTVLERRKQSSLKSEVEQKELQQLNDQLHKLERKTDLLVLEKGSLSTTLVSKEKTLAQAQARLKNEGADLVSRRHKIDTQRAVAQKQLDCVEDELLEIAAGQAPLLLVTGLLCDVAMQDQREEQSIRDQLMIEALASRDAEIIQELNDAGLPKPAIKTLSTILDRDRQKRAHSFSAAPFQALTGEARTRLNAILAQRDQIAEQLDHQIDAAERLQTTIINLDRKLASVPEDDALEHLTKSKDQALQAVTKLKVQIENIDDELAKITRERNSLVARIKRQLESTFDRDDSSRILIHSKKVRETLEKFRQSLVLKNAKKVEYLVLDSLTQLLRKKSLVAGIKIDPFTFEVQLTAADGKNLPPERLSAGERQLLASAMLWGLARAVGRALPAVIDTPLGRLDSIHRHHLVERYFPNASHQVILLSTDEEITEGYFQKLKNYVGRSYRLDFDEKNSCTKINPGYFW